MVTSPDAIPDLIDRLCAIYDESVANLRGALARYLKSGERPDPAARAAGAVRLSRAPHHYRPGAPAELPPRAFGRLNRPGAYAVSIARPYLFRKYLTEQLSYLVADYGVEVEVGRSASEIPYPYVLDATDDLRLDGARAADLALWFPTTELAHIGDEVADGAWIGGPDEPLPLSLFDGPRVDFSLARLRHYTGTPAEHSQRYLLFTNYVRYVDEFVRWAVEELERDDSPYEALSAPGGIFITKGTPDAVAKVQEGPWRKHQMPAYHLIADARRGDQPGQYRRRPVQRQDDLRSSGGDAAGGVADDRSLRRSPPEPVDRRLCPRPRLSARRSCHGRRAADRGADPGARRDPAGPVRRRGRGHRRGRRRS